MKNQTDYNYSASVGGCLHASRYGTIEGYYRSKNGIVIISYYDGGVNKKDAYATLHFIYNGRMYGRNLFKKQYTNIGLSRIASKFQREIIESQNT